MDERLYWLGFSVFPGIGPRRFKTLLKRFGSAKETWKVTGPGLVKAGLGEKLVSRFEKFRREFSLEGYANKLKEKKVWFLTLDDEEYPKQLQEIPNPPFVLYVKGSLPEQSILGVEPLIAVVGTRKITNYGREVTEFLVRDLVSAGFAIVSGLAIGIDSVAHSTAVENDGKTIAVLGCGVDCCTPATNQHLYNSIVDSGGLILSEFPLSQIPTKGSFPSRNRIIAGLSAGVLVTEGAEDSGSLITADYAFKFGRKVFAVPGPITSSLSRGPHKLLERGARLVTSGEDILKELQISNNKLQINTKVQSSKKQKGTREERRILEILENEELHIDEIVRRSGWDIAKISSLLSLMEIKGMLRDVGGGTFILAR